MTIDYQHPSDGNRNIPTKPVGILNVVQQYHLISYSEKLSESDARKACRSLDGTKDYWAQGDGEGIVLDGLLRLMDVAAAVRAKKGVTLDCKALEDATLEGHCAQEFLDDVKHPRYVNACSEHPHQAGQECFEYGLDKYRATIVRSWSTGGIPADAVKVELQYPEIIV